MTDLLILCGGRSEEHEISLLSAGCVLKALDRTEFRPHLVGIAKSGQWHLLHEPDFFVGEFRADKIRLNENTPQVMITPFLSPNGRGKLELISHSGCGHDAGGKVSGTTRKDNRAETIEFDVVFPLLHGQFGEDGTVQGLLEMIGIPFVGAHCEASAICMDKALTKALCQQAGIAINEYVVLRSLAEWETSQNKLITATQRLGLPFFVKCARQGSSVGVSKVSCLEELPDAIKKAFRHDTKVLIERAAKAREIECSVLGLNDSPRASLPGEIIPNSKIGWYSYEAKYLLSDGAETIAPAQLTQSEIRAIQQAAVQAFSVLECDGMARIDFFLEPGGRVILNEANTIPGFTPISMYPKMWEASGLSYSSLITKLIELAFEKQQKTRHS